MPELGAITCVFNKRALAGKKPGHLTRPFAPLSAQSAQTFHRSIPQYEPTPLLSLPNLARSLRLRNIWVKDESHRFNLNAFKALGAGYALAHSLGEKLAAGEELPSFDMLRSPSIRPMLRDITVATATDGNHGRAVAWSAENMGCNAVIYMPKQTSPARIRSVEAHGAKICIIDGNYDAAVRAAASDADANGWLLIQDTSWRGYERIPLWIMQGYLTIAAEAMEQLDGRVPTHVMLQCGVGSFAASMQAYFVERFAGGRCPFIGIVEPDRAACFYHSVQRDTGSPAAVRGDLHTIMAGLACGEPSILAWEILKNYSDAFFSCRDSIAMEGMRILANPIPGDPRIISGESGAVTAGLLVHLLSHPQKSAFMNALRLDSRSSVLLVSTEGDTDPDSYRKIVAGGTR